MKINLGWIYLLTVAGIVILALLMEHIDKKKPSFVISNLEQIFYYLSEIVFVCGGIVLLSNFLYPISGETIGIIWFFVLERFISFYAVYQIFVLVILNLVDSSYIDQDNAVLRLIELVEIYREYKTYDILTEVQELKKEIDDRIEILLNPGSLVSESVRNEVKEIKKRYNTPLRGNDLYFKELKILAESRMTKKGMFWQGSFILKILKNWPLKKVEETKNE